MSVKEEKMSDEDDEVYSERTIKREPIATECEDQCSYSLIKESMCDSEDVTDAVPTDDGNEFIKLEERETQRTDIDVPVKFEIEIGPTVIQPQYIGSSLHTTDASKAELIQCGGADVALDTTTPGAASFRCHPKHVVLCGTNDQKEDKELLEGDNVSKKPYFYKCASKSRLAEHMLVHTGAKPFSCNFCEYKCKQKSSLMIHIMRVHTGEKPFSCNFCEYKSADQSHMVRHIRAHTGEKPFSCNSCTFKSVEKSTMVNHMRLHTGKKPFSCNICDYKCSLKSYLLKHLRTHR